MRECLKITSLKQHQKQSANEAKRRRETREREKYFSGTKEKTIGTLSEVFFGKNFSGWRARSTDPGSEKTEKRSAP